LLPPPGLQPPDAQIKLQVKGPLIGEREVPQFSFMRNALLSGIQDTLVEPRRWAARNTGHACGAAQVGSGHPHKEPRR